MNWMRVSIKSLCRDGEVQRSEHRGFGKVSQLTMTSVSPTLVCLRLFSFQSGYTEVFEISSKSNAEWEMVNKHG